MKKSLALMFCVCVFLSSCGLTKKDLGLAKNIHDETKVETKRPLDLPPDFDKLPE